jgi:hypothetical protein
MKLLGRLLLLAFGTALVVSTWSQSGFGTPWSSLHDLLHRYGAWLRDVRDCSMFAVLILCLLVVRRDPLFTRIGIACVLAALTITVIPPRVVHQAVRKIDGIHAP